MSELVEVNEKGHMVFAGRDVVELAQTFQTPLFVYNVEKIRKNAKAFVDGFKSLGVKAQVAYASKAFSSVAMLQVAKQEGLSLDVVSQGELYTAMKAGFPMEKVHLHGNNKSREELKMALEQRIGCIVIDNFHDIALLKELLVDYDGTMDVLLRVTPGIEAHTHDYILTGNEDSKFGFDLKNQAKQAYDQIKQIDRLHLKGLHCHIGSQIFETDGFIMAVKRLYEVLVAWHVQDGFEATVLNLGGGFGIRYTDEDEPLPLDDYVSALVDEVTKEAHAHGLSLPEIWIEPGRAIVGDTAITLYEVGSKKEIPNVRNYVAVDGGMTDNIRPALYQAKYDAIIANKAHAPKTYPCSIAGKCCESGDMLIYDTLLPEVTPGDILAVFSTGAYGYSMASHYNRFTKPAVVFVEDGEAKLVVKRETYADVTQNDLSYE
ncbi:diaminopimelate decarboxylase [Halolactibacillus miurensis]|uniref:Diaminopimelate decarboxylase n=1 Tax=Halolactibacillus miurensis TaxID=306541 RepID=A0A1I6PUW1_9BACI|nr:MULTISPECIES: diaminopimelate decarboxylase [Halolactibacillus]GEM04465.1 diaminopimelate decarboxylase [Halolactibacillus miurensis]SFS44017.1 diaminopimelate decarboxylase [Halolactibacillus miurensis]